MIRHMELTSSELLLYAIIYSFTVTNLECTASREYFAKRLNTSVRTVERMLKSLKNKGYIKKVGTNSKMNNVSVYVALVSEASFADKRTDSLYTYPDKNYTINNCVRQNERDIPVTPTPTNCCEIIPRMSPNEKENKKEIKNTTSTSSTVTYTQAKEVLEKAWEDIRRGYRDDGKDPVEYYISLDKPYGEIYTRYELITTGEEQIVTMSYDQYDALIDQYGMEITEQYVERLEKYLIENLHAKSFSHYATIKKWIEEDFSV